MLRAVAAILVVLHHSYPKYEAMGGKLQPIIALSKWGFAGVDIFFVISGFIMAYTTFIKERNIKNAKTFIKHRLFRIYLGYWPFFFIMLFALLLSNPQKLNSLDIPGSFFLGNTDMFQLVLPVSWSLSYELYFYFLFLFTFFLSIRKLYIFIPLFIIFITFLIFLSFFKMNFSNSFFYSPFLLEFFSGVLLYMYKKYLIKIWIIPILLIAIVFSYGIGIEYGAKSGLYRVLTFGTGALLVVHLALILEQTRIFRAGNLLKSIGDASYTLYLSHLIIIQVFFHIGLIELFSSNRAVMPVIGLFFIVFLSISFSLLYYRMVERPVYQRAINAKGIL